MTDAGYLPICLAVRLAAATASLSADDASTVTRIVEEAYHQGHTDGYIRAHSETTAREMTLTSAKPPTT